MVAQIPPSLLYRYRRSSPDYFIDELVQAIHKQKIFLTGLSNVNDPFEAMPFFQSNTLREVRKFLAEFERIFGKGVAITGTNYQKFAKENGVSKRAVQAHVGKSVESARNTISSLRNSFDHLRSVIRIACFSERWDSLLMWGHYAESHAGVCIEYAPKIEVAARERIAPLAMEYSEVRPVVSYIELMEHIALANNNNKSGFFNEERALRTFNSIAMTKPREWEYEQEWRIMDIGNSNAGYFFVPSLEPVSVLLGAKHSEKTRKAVHDAVAGKVDIEVVCLDDARFGLRRKLLFARR